ncbi:hypothetical protein L210DRAFT_3730520 [Boletus edulis BED1]|uniref:Uncharacterized protein n=1 Tax=Boletus edulis BED1 TaxID=1328754 RepID=A0AAD4BI40_BOLED|nr:hypothetical protein L210DRAFT_3730520 [Boletus edulis BED1]
MSDPYFHYAQMDDESDGPPFSFAGTHSNPGYHTLGRTRYSLIHQASHAASVVSPEFRRNVFLPEDWLAGPSQTPRVVPPTQFDPPQFPFQSTLALHGYRFCRALPTALHPTSTVAMPTPNGIAQYDDGLMDAHAYHYDPSFGLVYDSCMAKDPPAIPSPHHPHADCSDIHRPSPSGNVDFSSYSSTSSPPSSIGQSPVAPLTKMSDQIQPQSITTASFDQHYTITVSLDTIEFPPVPTSGNYHSSSAAGRTVEYGSLASTTRSRTTWHASTTWRSRRQRTTRYEYAASGLIARRLRKGAGMVVVLGVLVAYTRPDSVMSHANGKPRCELAQPVSYPSEMAYRARRNGDGTVTLTKIVQP